MNKRILLGVDNGNSHVKTSEGFIFQTGYVKSKDEPILKKNLLVYNNEYYNIGLGANRLNVQLDKSESEDAWILTMACIADKLEKEGIENESVDIILAVGLPIISYSRQKDKFRQYFLRDNVEFVYNKKQYTINVVSCKVYPQGYAAFLTLFNDYKDISTVNVIDIGGMTIDIFKTEFSIINVTTCHSITRGIITLLAEIEQELLKDNIRLSEKQIEEVILGKDVYLFDENIRIIVMDKVKDYVSEILGSIMEKGFELRNPTLFVGGGSTLIKNILEDNKNLKYIEFLDQFANANGYLMLLKQEYKSV